MSGRQVQRWPCGTPSIGSLAWLVVITGANSGIGFEAARALGAKGAHVVLAVRDPYKGHAAAEAIQREHPLARTEVLMLDLADLDSVRGFVEEFRARHASLRVLPRAGTPAWYARALARATWAWRDGSGGFRRS